MDLKEIGRTLKDARAKKNIRKEKIFKNTRIHPGVLEAMENGTAMETLSRPYMRGFLKKYAEFLELDSNQILKDFDSLQLKEPRQVLTLDGKDELQEKRKTWLPALSAIIIFLFIISMMVLGLRARLNLAKKTSAPLKEKPAAVAQTGKKAPAVKASGRSLPRGKAAPFALTLRTNQDVWIRVSKDGSKVFEGILPKGSAEKWQADQDINIRSGKTEALEFILDGRSKGIIGEGVKDIVVTKEGVEIAD